jgi:hypothetical protein
MFAIHPNVGHRCTQPNLPGFSAYINSTNPGIKTSLGELWEIA